MGVYSQERVKVQVTISQVFIHKGKSERVRKRMESSWLSMMIE